jgi:hypothetical protein
MQFSELVEAALLEQYRWEVGCEAMYRAGIRCDPIDRAVLMDMLKLFGVARTLSKDGKDKLNERLGDIAKCLEKNGWEKVFRAVGESSNDLYVKGSKNKKTGIDRAFVSGLTKVLWFRGAHRMPMFDSYTRKTVGARNGNTADAAVEFYRLLKKEWEYDDAWSTVEAAIKGAQLNWCFFPERFLDKILLLKGLGDELQSKSVVGTQEQRKRFLGTLQKEQAEGLLCAKDAIVKELGKCCFKRKLPD